MNQSQFKVRNAHASLCVCALLYIRSSTGLKYYEYTQSASESKLRLIWFDLIAQSD